MDEKLKQRLVGGAVIISLIVIFVPMLLDDPVDPEQAISVTRIPEKPRALQKQLESQKILPKPINTQPIEAKTVKPQPIEIESKPVELDKESPEPVEKIEKTVISERPVGKQNAKMERPTPSAWLIQVASFTRQDNANRLKERLRKANMPAQLQEVTIDGKRHYRVQMLPQLDRKEAEILIKRIKKEFKLTASLIRYSE